MSDKPAYARGFESVESEYAGVDLDVEGSLPAWIRGSLYRNGPGLFETVDGSLSHWFDGLAMLRRFRFDGPEDRITYTNRFLRSTAYKRATSIGLQAGQFGTGGGAGPLDRLRAQLIPETTDNANVNVIQLGDELVAVTETPEMIAFDRQTLGTRGSRSYDDDIAGQWQSAHPLRDPQAGETVNLLVNFGRTTSYKVVTRRDGATSREQLASIPVEEPAYTHSFALTDRYIVLTEPPYVVNPKDLVLPWRGGDAFVDSFRWEPERGTRFRLIDRETGSVSATCRGPSQFVFHHVNATEREGEVVVDLVGFPDDRAIEQLYLDALRAGDASPEGTLWRLGLPMDGGAVTRREIANGLSLPRTNDDYLTSDHRYTWAQGIGPGSGFADRLVKAAPKTGIAASWQSPGWFVGEPVIASNPDGNEPDEGVALTVALAPDAQRSVLVVLDATTLDELARAPLPHVVPFDFHGRFVPAPADRATVSPR